MATRRKTAKPGKQVIGERPFEAKANGEEVGQSHAGQVEDHGKGPPSAVYYSESLLPPGPSLQ